MKRSRWPAVSMRRATISGPADAIDVRLAATLVYRSAKLTINAEAVAAGAARNDFHEAYAL